MTREEEYRDTVFLGWYDPDKKRKAAVKLADACDRFAEKFDRQPNICLVGPEYAEELGPESCGCRVEARTYLARHIIYVGRIEREEIPRNERESNDPAESVPQASATGTLEERPAGAVRQPTVRQDAAEGLGGLYRAAPLPGL